MAWIFSRTQTLLLSLTTPSRQKPFCQVFGSGFRSSYCIQIQLVNTDLSLQLLSCSPSPALRIVSCSQPPTDRMWCQLNSPAPAVAARDGPLVAEYSGSRQIGFGGVGFPPVSGALCVFLSNGSFGWLSGSEGDRAVEQVGMPQTLHSTDFSVSIAGQGGLGWVGWGFLLCLTLYVSFLARAVLKDWIYRGVRGIKQWNRLACCRPYIAPTSASP